MTQTASHRKGSGDRRPGLIALTPNPYLNFGLRLGGDEVGAWVLSTVATFVVGTLLRVFGQGVPGAVQAVVLAVTGPLAEKPGLFLRYFVGAFREYRLAGDERRSRRRYVGQALREGWPSLRADLLYHDPAYAVLLWVLLRVTGTESVTGATLLALVSFVGAIAIASTLEVLYVDLRYALLRRRLSRAGFVHKTYHETRFFVDPGGDATFGHAAVLKRLQEEFDLPERRLYTYRDLYVTENSLAVYNGRRPYLRFRQRHELDPLNPDQDNPPVSKQAVQVMYTRARQVATDARSLYRCFATLKQKAGFDFGHHEEMPWQAAQINEPRVRRVVKRLQAAGGHREVRFTRHVAMDPKGILVSVDLCDGTPGGGDAYWLEVKSRDDLETLRNVSDYVAWKFPVRATTLTKCEALTDGDGR